MDRDRELELVRRLRHGDHEAFDEIHGVFNTRLFNFLARLTNRREIAEDLLEETWLRLVTHAHRLQPDTRLAAWLFTVARRLHVSYCRSRLLEDAYAADLLTLWPGGVHPPSPLEAAEADETGRRLEHALALLPVASREALLLVAVEGLTPAEAAAVCGISADAMRQRVSRARAMLAERLGPGRGPTLRALREVRI